MTGNASATPGAPAIALSACIIARDEEAALPDCLASVAFCDEIVVVDSGSTDRTVAIAQAAGARVVEQPWLGFGAQRNVAIDHARGDWVLEVDADERVTPALAAEIRRFVAAAPDDVDLAGLPLRDLLVGRRLGPSAKYPKYRHRLVRRGTLRHDEHRTVHEGLIAEGPVHPFEGDLEHLLATSWGEAIGDAWRYARLEAEQLQAPRGPRGLVVGGLLRPTAKVAYRLVIDGGWRDGAAGLAKILLDAGGDSAVWFRHVLVRRDDRRGDSGRHAGQHYGAWTFRQGSIRMVAVAYGAGATADAARWLATARATGGADVTLVADRPAPDGAEVRVRAPQRSGPLALARALEVEEQLRSYDAVITFGGRAARLMGRVPGRLRGAVQAQGAQDTPQIVHDRALAAREELRACA
ncbi:MAG TPA: glycosyltransferase family 2 protein [Baekduia sp.]|nr:glycosyltransferase family 2 protein [Baekduia sp.]